MPYNFANRESLGLISERCRCGRGADCQCIDDAIARDGAGKLAEFRQERPRFGTFQRPVLTDHAPEGAEWSHEFYYEGDRVQLHVCHGLARISDADGRDWTGHCDALLDEAQRLPCETAVIDGTLVAPHGQRDLAGSEPEFERMMAFDLVELDGEDVRRHGLERRRELLAKLLGPNDPCKSLAYSDHVIGGGNAFFAAMTAMGRVGMVSKRLGSPYGGGAYDDWVMTQCFMEREVVLIGIEPLAGAHVALLACEEDGRLHFAGRARIALGRAERERLQQAVEALSLEGPAIPVDAGDGVAWMQPVMRGCVRTLRGNRHLRQATLLSITTPPMAFG